MENDKKRHWPEMPPLDYQLQPQDVDLLLKEIPQLRDEALAKATDNESIKMILSMTQLLELLLFNIALARAGEEVAREELAKLRGQQK